MRYTRLPGRNRRSSCTASREPLNPAPMMAMRVPAAVDVVITCSRCQGGLALSAGLRRRGTRHCLEGALRAALPMFQYATGACKVGVDMRRFRSATPIENFLRYLQ